MEKWMTTEEAAKRSDQRISRDDWQRIRRKFMNDETLCRKFSETGGYVMWVISEKMFKIAMKIRKEL